jgi:hypothetical protein
MRARPQTPVISSRSTGSSTSRRRGRAWSPTRFVACARPRRLRGGRSLRRARRRIRRGGSSRRASPSRRRRPPRRRGWFRRRHAPAARRVPLAHRSAPARSSVRGRRCLRARTERSHPGRGRRQEPRHPASRHRSLRRRRAVRRGRHRRCRALSLDRPRRRPERRRPHLGHAPCLESLRTVSSPADRRRRRGVPRHPRSGHRARGLPRQRRVSNPTAPSRAGDRGRARSTPLTNGSPCASTGYPIVTWTSWMRPSGGGAGLPVVEDGKLVGS